MVDNLSYWCYSQFLNFLKNFRSKTVIYTHIFRYLKTITVSSRGFQTKLHTPIELEKLSLDKLNAIKIGIFQFLDQNLSNSFDLILSRFSPAPLLLVKCDTPTQQVISSKKHKESTQRVYEPHLWHQILISLVFHEFSFFHEKVTLTPLSIPTASGT